MEEKNSTYRMVENLKRFIDHEVFSHRLQPVFDQSFHNDHPTSAADETLLSAYGRAPDKSPEQAAGAVHALVVPMVPVDENQRFGHAIHALPVVATGRGGIIDQPATELGVRLARGHRRVIDKLRRRGRQQTSSHVTDHAVADPPPQLWTPRPVRVKVQRGQRATQLRHVGRERRPVVQCRVHNQRGQIGVRYARGCHKTLVQPVRVMAQPVLFHHPR